MFIQIYSILILQVISCTSNDIKPTFSFDEFFNYTTFKLFDFSPNGQHLIIQTKRPSWNTSSYEKTLWLYDVQNQTKKLITTNLHPSITPKWSPSGDYIGLIPKKHIAVNQTNDQQSQQYIYLYSLLSDTLLPIEIGNDTLLSFTWSANDSTIYIAVINTWSNNKEVELYKDEWKDAIQYRERFLLNNSTIYCIDLNLNNILSVIDKNVVRQVSFLVGELLYVSYGKQLIFSSVSKLVEDLNDFELYSINLENTSKLSRLTNNGALELRLQVSNDGHHILFQTMDLSGNKRLPNHGQIRLYSLNLINGKIKRLAEKFHGSIFGYTNKNTSSVYILGQLGTQVHIYTQKLSSDILIEHIGWNGTYESIVSSNKTGSIAFIHSSSEKPMEIYFIENIDQLKSPRAITNENELFTRRNLPQTKLYQWRNEDDHRMIEGILHYPPEKFEAKNLSLLVLIHGGPHWASLNKLELVWHEWAPLAASEGWLVLEPNYRGSTGYGDDFLNEVRFKPLSRPGKDILYGIDQLIKDGIVNPHRLAIGGYSYGGFLTNWLITQTQRFNAALSGSGAADYVSMWSTTDLPEPLTYLFGGFPWEVPDTYKNESPMYQLHRIRTPTHIVTGEDDNRVPTSQSYMLERGLHSLRVPVKLLGFPKEGHSISINPWYGKIKAREELKWLKKYCHQSKHTIALSDDSSKLRFSYTLQLYILLFSFL